MKFTVIYEDCVEFEVETDTAAQAVELVEQNKFNDDRVTKRRSHENYGVFTKCDNEAER